MKLHIENETNYSNRGNYVHFQGCDGRFREGKQETKEMAEKDVPGGQRYPCMKFSTSVFFSLKETYLVS